MQESHSINFLCELFRINRSSYQYWVLNRHRIYPEKVRDDAKVNEIFKLSKGSAGARTIAQIATTDGYPLTRYRAEKAMNRLGLVSCQPPKPNHKPAKKEHLQIKNKLNREFSPIKPNQVWCGDVTYIWTGTEFMYLACVLDLYSRKIVGFSMSNSPDSELTKQALNNAFEMRGRPKNVMFHSDQGCHYTSKDFQQLIWRLQMNQSMSRRGNCWDNAPMERFFRSLKTENMKKKGYKNEYIAKESIRNYIHKYYNSIRPHSHNIGLSPNAKEEFYNKTSKALPKFS